jgi:hypothetical protein
MGMGRTYAGMASIINGTNIGMLTPPAVLPRLT